MASREWDVHSSDTPYKTRQRISKGYSNSRITDVSIERPITRQIKDGREGTE